MRIEVEPGVDIHYVDLGPATAAPIVFLHAFGFMHRSWERQIADLCGDFRTVAIDLRGHGLSSKPAVGYSPSRLAADVGAVLDHLGLRDVTLVGWSLGGAIAVRTVAQDATRIGRLVLVGPYGPLPIAHPENPGAITEDAKAAVLLALGATPEDFRWTTVQSMPKVPYTQAVQLELFAQASHCPAWAGAQLAAALFDDDFRDDAERVSLPTLIIQGRADIHVPEGRIREYERRIKDSRVEFFEESGHSPNIEEADRFNKAIRVFIGN